MLFYLTLVFGLILAQVNGLCSSGFIEGFNNQLCYKFYGSPMNFYDAEAQCEDIQGHLASISSALNNSFVAKELKDLLWNPQSATWIGGFKSGIQWTWTDGAPFTYASWGLGQPNPNYQCVSINSTDTKWYTNNCQNVELPFLCEVSSISAPTSSPPPVCHDHCDPGWTYNNVTNFCYKVYTPNNLNWAASEKFCVNQGAHLASIHSWTENVFVAEISKSGEDVDSSLDQVWIGLTDHNGSEEMGWTDGSPYDYQNWGADYPDYDAGDRCGSIDSDHYSQSDYSGYYQKWEVLPCDTTSSLRAFVCKKAVNKT